MGGGSRVVGGRQMEVGIIRRDGKRIGDGGRKENGVGRGDKEEGEEKREKGGGP